MVPNQSRNGTLPSSARNRMIFVLGIRLWARFLSQETVRTETKEFQQQKVRQANCKTPSCRGATEPARPYPARASRGYCPAHRTKAGQWPGSDGNFSQYPIF